VVACLGDRNGYTVHIFRGFNILELSIPITDCAGLNSPQKQVTFTVEGHRGECGLLLQTITNNGILELSFAITEQMRSVKSDPKVSFSIRHKSAHSANRRRVRKGSLNQGESKPIEADEAPLRSDPEVAIMRLADGIDGSPDESSVCSPLIVNVLRHCPAGVQSASWVHETDTRDPGQKATT
jgi:hypothetical protein